MTPETLSSYARMFALLALATKAQAEDPCDILGDVYHQLGLNNEWNGQFFTPDHICRLMAQLTDIDVPADKEGPITINEPTCGSGTMVKTIKKFGLPSKITEDIIGNHLVFLQKAVPEAEYSNYVLADATTNIELFEYKPAPYKAVRILKDGETYYYAWFCNYLVENNESLSIQTAFDVYGIDDSTDIVSITPVKSDNYWKANVKAITDTTIISNFYTEISKLSDFSFDEYHELVFADDLKKAEDEGGGDIGSELYSRVADDRKDILIETKDGLRFTIQYYPSYGWINIAKTLSYYQMSPEIEEWFEVNTK